MQRHLAGAVLLGMLVTVVAGCPDMATVTESEGAANRHPAAPAAEVKKPEVKKTADDRGFPQPKYLTDFNPSDSGSGGNSGAAKPYGDEGHFALPKTIGATTLGTDIDTGSGEDDQTRALNRVSAEIRNALKFKKTLVVWLFDQASDSTVVRRSVVGEMHRVSQNAIDRSRSNGGGGSPLSSVVISYGHEVNLLTPEPVDDLTKVDNAASGITDDSSAGASVTFTAIHRAVEQFLPYRGKGFEMIFVIVANNAGKDYATFEDDVRKLKRTAVPVYGIGYAVPFARVSGGFGGGNAAGSDPPCESVAMERINMALPGGQSESDLMDSGYGPFGLEWLCHATEGRFLRIRPAGPGLGWELNSNREVSAELLRKYAPNFVSDKQYEQLLSENKARMALHNAAKLPYTMQLGSTTREFYRGSNEAALVRAISMAQRAAAEREPDVNKLYDTLVAGESDRPKLTGARWQAEYDLAMGRVLAAKARIDGYNTQLAVVKQGKAFKNPGSSVWVLASADTISAGSVLEKLAKNSRMYLNRVIQEHPGTPWAAMAIRELTENVGWEWSEH